MTLAAVQAVPGAGGSAQDHAMRPAHTTKLTPDTFDKFVQDATDNKKTAFVRWMFSDDMTKDCKWVRKGFHIWGHMDGDWHEGDDLEGPVDENGDPIEDEAEEGGEEFPIDLLVKQAKTDPCGLAQAQAAAWNDITKKYSNDPDVVFGDVVVADHKELVAQLKASYVPPLGHQDPDWEEHESDNPSENFNAHDSPGAHHDGNSQAPEPMGHEEVDEDGNPIEGPEPSSHNVDHDGMLGTFADRVL